MDPGSRDPLPVEVLLRRSPLCGNHRQRRGGTVCRDAGRERGVTHNAPPGIRWTLPLPKWTAYSANLPLMRTRGGLIFTFFNPSSKQVSWTRTSRISTVEAVASGSTPPRCATLTTRSRSRITSLNRRGGTSGSFSGLNCGPRIPADCSQRELILTVWIPSSFRGSLAEPRYRPLRDGNLPKRNSGESDPTGTHRSTNLCSISHSSGPSTQHRFTASAFCVTFSPQPSTTDSICLSFVFNSISRAERL
ncbi:MAG: hypothetical protein JWM11_3212 [Planctomycetaceae bacterium]|nr:hypothetical protein [Planctomycetaceae bacterium]